MLIIHHCLNYKRSPSFSTVWASSTITNFTITFNFILLSNVISPAFMLTVTFNHCLNCNRAPIRQLPTYNQYQINFMHPSQIRPFSSAVSPKYIFSPESTYLYARSEHSIPDVAPIFNFWEYMCFMKFKYSGTSTIRTHIV